LLNFAAFLDPRFKQLDPFVVETEREDVIEDVVSEILLTYEDEHQDDDIVESSQVDDDEDFEETEPATKKRRSSIQFTGRYDQNQK